VLHDFGMPGHRRSRRGWRGYTVEDLEIGVVAAASGAGTAMAGASPTGLESLDLALCAMTGALLSAACARARRWSWLVMAGLSAPYARSDLSLIAATLAVVLAFGAAVSPTRRPPLLGGLVGGLAAQALFRNDLHLFAGDATLLAILAALPMLTSSYRHARRSTRRTVRLLLAGVGGTVATISVVTWFVALGALADVRAGAADAERGLEAARDGDREQAVAALEDAASAFGGARTRLNAPWLRPARVVPVLGQQVMAASAMATSGERISAAAAIAAAEVDYDELRASAGQVDLAILAAAADPLRDASKVLSGAETRLARVESPWLLPSVATRLDALRTDVAEASAEADLAALAVEVAPGLLGATSDQRYLVAFATPAESRYLGGFVGSYGVLTAIDGEVALVESGPIDELNPADGESPHQIEGIPGFVQRYVEWFPGRFAQNATITPHFPSAADVLRQHYLQATGESVDGVIYVDPFGLAALLELTGPVNVEGLEGRLSARNAADLLLREQYELFDIDSDRQDLLAAALEATFEALTDVELPGPRRLARVLGPAVRGGRLMVEVFDPGATELLDLVGTRGQIGSIDQTDVVSLRTANATGNKIDVYLRRSLDYDVAYDPETGHVAATATVVLTNDAPTSGLPEYVIGNEDTKAGRLDGMPRGTSRTSVAFYSTLPVRSVRVDGDRAAARIGRDQGLVVTTLRLDVAPGASRTLTFELDGSIDRGGAYRVLVGHQPLSQPDDVSVRVRSALDTWRPRDRRDGVVVIEEAPEEDLAATVSFMRR
jgi:hypothetical protein